MKRIILSLCTALAILCSINNLYAQHAPSTNITRSEQFILDSMRMEIEKGQLETQYDMYTDSLNMVTILESNKINAGEDAWEFLIPTIFFLTILAIIWLALYYARRKQKDRYEIIEKALDKGASLPQGIFDEPKKKQKSWLNTLRSGTTTLGCGLGIFGLGIYTEEEIFMGLALIPSFIGLGYLLVALLEYRFEKQQNDSTGKPALTDESDPETPSPENEEKL